MRKSDGVKCDGNHGGDPCGDSECWQLEPCDQQHGGPACEDPHCYKKDAHNAREAVSEYREC